MSKKTISPFSIIAIISSLLSAILFHVVSFGTNTLAPVINLLATPIRLFEQIINIFQSMSNNVKAGGDRLSSYNLPPTYDDTVTITTRESSKLISDNIQHTKSTVPVLSIIAVLIVIIAIAAFIFPIIAKHIRVKNNQKGQGLEIIALILSSYSFFCVWEYVFVWQSTWSDILKIVVLIAYIVIYIKTKATPSIANT